MGFKAKRKLYKLVFADEDMHGLEVTMMSVSTGDLLLLQSLSGGGEATAKDPGKFRDLIGLFVGAMVSWNLEDDNDVPVPVTIDGALTQEPGFLMEIISSWATAISGVSGPLDGSSTSGETFQEALLPMEPLLQSLSS